jgi:hypothetical protein
VNGRVIGGAVPEQAETLFREEILPAFTPGGCAGTCAGCPSLKE